MRSMLKPALALVAMVLGTTATADEPPPVPDGGLTHYHNEPCTDAVFGLDGTCFYSLDRQNNRYMAFYVNDMGYVIYRLEDGSMVEIWRRQPDV